MLSLSDCNIISVLWHELAKLTTEAGLPILNYTYDIASRNSNRVGRYTADMLARLMERTGLKHDDLHLIGHSLGAHGVGEIGRNLTLATGSRPRRVSGQKALSVESLMIFLNVPDNH